MSAQRIAEILSWLDSDAVLDESTRAEYAHRLATYAKPVAPELPFYAPKEGTE